jgi:hypothetical protein
VRNHRRGWRGLGDSTGGMQQGAQYLLNFVSRSYLAGRDPVTVAATIRSKDTRYGNPLVNINSTAFSQSASMSIGFTWTGQDSPSIVDAGTHLAEIVNSLFGINFQFHDGGQVGSPASAPPAGEPYKTPSGQVIIPNGWSVDADGNVWTAAGSIYDNVDDLPVYAPPNNYTAPGTQPINLSDMQIPWNSLMWIGGLLAGVYIVANAL